MHEHGALGTKLVAELTDRLEERQALDVADGAANFHQDEVEAGGVADDRLLDRVGDVRDHLDGGAQVIAAALLGDHLGVDAAGGGVVEVVGRHAGEALVVAQVQVGLGPVVGDVDLPVLVGAHRAGVDVQVGVQLAQPHGEAARLQQGAEGGGGNAFAEGGDHAAGDEHVPRHGRPVYGAELGDGKPALAGSRMRQAGVGWQALSGGKGVGWQDNLPSPCGRGLGGGVR